MEDEVGVSDIEELAKEVVLALGKEPRPCEVQYGWEEPYGEMRDRGTS